ncbi:lipopolysaccharide biosynthesis protein [Phocaeicola sp.]
MNQSRTNKSITNARFALLFYIVNLIVNFISRKVFLDRLGIEILGLNTTATNLIGFLNIAELGIGMAVSYSLYKPLLEKDRKVINEIVSVQGWLYRRIALLIIGVALVLMLFFPLLFKNTLLPLWYSYGVFCVLLAGTLLSYFVNYRQIVLSADQKNYKITINVEGLKIIKIIFQIVAVIYLKHGYFYWLLLESLFSLIVSFTLNYTIRKEYPWLNTNLSEGKSLSKKYPEIITKTKQLFFHRISSFVLNQTSPLIIYGYASLSIVAIYGNYMLIISGIVLLLSSLLNGISAGIGNLVAEGNHNRIKAVYWEITSFRMWIASICCFCLYYLSDGFISLWMGKDLVLTHSAFIVLLFYTFIVLTRTNDAFISAYGLYQDIWAPIVEAILNIGGAIILGYFWGVTGVLGGSVISLLVIVCMWKPYLLYKKGFNEDIHEYIRFYLRYMLLIIVAFVCSSFILNSIKSCIQMSNICKWLLSACIVFLVYSIISGVIFYMFDSSIRKVIVRIKNML